MLLLQSHNTRRPTAIGDIADYRYDHLIVIVGEFTFAYNTLIRQRASSNDIIIVILPAESPVDMTVKLLNAGADDVVLETINRREWELRIKAKLRWLEQDTPETLSYGCLCYCPNNRQATAHGRSTTLSLMLGRILEVMLRHPQGMSHTSLKEAVYHDYHDADRPTDRKVMDVQVHHLNKALRELTGVTGVIETVWGQGRRLSDRLKAADNISTYAIAAE